MDMEKEIQILNIDDILPNRFQPRIQFNDKNINELADSIKEHGVIQPIVVRKVSDKYEIIAGERRYKASILAGKSTIPAIVTNLDDKNSAEIALIENVQRQDLTPIEEAVSYKKILDMGYLNQSSLAEKLGKTQSTIANKLRLLNLNDDVQEALLDGKISERHARSLLKLDSSHQTIMVNRIIEERLTVRKTDEEIDKMINSENIIVKESEEPVMDEKIMNEFHLPTNPIVDEPVEKENTNDLNQNINPGFMDINKIETTAEDIFKPSQPTPNLDMLMEKEENFQGPSSSSAAMQPIIDHVEEDNPPRGGRFFNMFGITQEEDKNPNYVSDVENKTTNMDFEIPTNSIPAFNPFNTEPTVNDQPNLYANNFENSVTTDFIQSSLSQENTIPENQLVNNVETINEPMFHPVQPYTLNDDEEFSFKEQSNDVSNSFASMPNSVENSNQNSEVELNQSVNFTNNIFEDSNIDSLGDNSKAQNEISSFTNIEPVTPIYEDNISNNNEMENHISNNNFINIINNIRDCAKTIENAGYNIETEEIDFEDSYQVIFKIEKK